MRVGIASAALWKLPCASCAEGRPPRFRIDTVREPMKGRLGGLKYYHRMTMRKKNGNVCFARIIQRSMTHTSKKTEMPATDNRLDFTKPTDLFKAMLPPLADARMSAFFFFLTPWRMCTKEPSTKRTIPGLLAGCVSGPTQKFIVAELPLDRINGIVANDTWSENKRKDPGAH